MQLDPQNNTFLLSQDKTDNMTNKVDKNKDNEANNNLHKPLRNIKEKVIHLSDYKWEKWKYNYYRHFFQFDRNKNTDKLNYICKQYIKSLLFTFKYYYVGLPSWSWYYEFQTSPLPSDIYNAILSINDINDLGTFKMNRPCKPFQQLMLILPPQNSILPQSYLNLMKNSPISRYYPTKFKLNIIWGEKFIYAEPILPRLSSFKIITEIKNIKLNQRDAKRNRLRYKPFIYSPQ